MFMRTILYFFLLLSSVVAAAAPLSPPDSENSQFTPERSRQGLGRFRGPRVEEEDNTRATTTKHLRPEGYIGIHKGDGTGPLLGYLDCHQLVPTIEKATRYALIAKGIFMEIEVVGTRERMAVATGPSGPDLGRYSKNFHVARHTRFSSIAGAGPGHDKEQALLYETTIFAHDSEDEDMIEVEWVNMNGEYTTTEIALMNNRIYYTGDIAEFRRYTKQKVDHVAYKWYPAAKPKVRA